MSGRGGPNDTATYNTVYVRITVGMAYNNGVPNDWFWSVTPDVVPLGMTPSSQQPDKVVFTLEAPFNVQNGQPGNAPLFGWDDDGGPTGGVVMDTGWDTSWGTPQRGSGVDQNHYVLQLTGPGPSTNTRYPYTVKVKYGGTPISFDPEIELGSA